MRFPGFIGAAYTLDSVNVDTQRCINLYLEKIESGRGKEGEEFYLRSTPGLNTLINVGTGPIRLVHADSNGRIFVASGSQLFSISQGLIFQYFFVAYQIYNLIQSSGTISTSSGQITQVAHAYVTGLKVQVASSGTLPGGLSAATDYFVIVVDANNFKLATSLANSLAGTSITISSVGSGTLTVTPQISTPSTSVIAINSNTITQASHGLYTGLELQFNELPAIHGNLSFLTNYFVIVIDSNNFQLATTIQNASAATAITLGSVSGTWSAILVGSNGLAGGLATNFNSSTGRVKAKSMSFLGNGTDSSTLFVDGSQMMLFLDNGNQTSNFGANTAFGYLSVDSATDITWIDSYFLVNQGGTNKFFASDIQSFNFNALEFGAAEGAPDIIYAVEASYRNLCLFTNKSTEVFADTGNANFPFERIQGGFVEIGILAQYSVGKFDDGTLVWLGVSERGRGIVYAASGLNPQRISTHVIEQEIASYASPASATAFTYQVGGHSFYCLNFAEATWVFDLSTGMWHERAYTNNGALERGRPEYHTYAPTQGIHLVGDYATNAIYQMQDGVFTDGGAQISRIRSAPHLTSDMNRVFCSHFELDMETGVGLDGGVQGANPQVMLDWSNDGGHTWSNERWSSAGKIGSFRQRVQWRRLGAFRDRVFRIKITDPVKVDILGANMELDRGDN